MMDVTVKTLDGQNRNYSIPEKMTVREFKDKIAHSINISADVQRLIFQGRVMQDDKPLKDYDIHGKVIHVVERPPPGAASPRTSSAPSNPTPTGQRDISSIVVGSFNLPSEILEPNQVQNVFEQAVNNMGDMGRNARVSTRSSADGSAVDVHIHLGQVPAAQVESEAQLRLNNARRMLRLAKETLDRLENPSRMETGQENSASDQTDTASPMEAASPPSYTGPSSTAPRTGDALGFQNLLSSVLQMNSSQIPSSQTSTSQTATSQGPVQSGSTEQTADTPPSTQNGTAPQNRAPPSGPTGTATQNGAPPSGPTGRPAQPRGGPRAGPNRPRLRALAEVLTEIHEINGRFQPHLEEYQKLMEEDPELEQSEVQDRQRVCNLVSETLHALSHCYHSVSDIMADMSQPRPRQLYATLATTVAMPAAIIQQAMPVQAHINVASPHLLRGPLGPGAGHPPSHRQPPAQPPTTATATATPPTTQAAPLNNNTQTSAGPPPSSQTGPRPSPLVQSQSSTEPYVFVEVGPDSVTVNSISAHVVTTTESSNPPPTVPATAGSTNTGTTTTPSAFTGTSAFSGTTPMQTNGANLPPTLVQNIVQSILQTHTGAGLRPGVPHTFSINGQIPSFMRQQGAGNSSTQTTQLPTNTAGTQTQIPQCQRSTPSTSADSVTSNTNTSGTQTGQTPQNNSGTQTQGNRPNPLNNSGTQTQVPPCGTAFVVPGMPGLVPPRPVDQYLPCSSRHFLTQQARNLASNPPPQNSENALAGMVTNLMSGLLGQPNSNIQVSSSLASSTPSQSSRAATTTTTPSSQIPTPLASVFSGGAFGMPPGGAFGLPPGLFGQPLSQDAGQQRGRGAEEPQFVNMLRNLLQGGGAPPQPEAPRPPTAPTAPQPPEQAAMTDEAFTQLVHGISEYVTQTALGQTPTDTISDFLNNLGDNYNIVPGEGFVNDLFQCILGHLTFPDLMQVFFGNPETLNNIRIPLRNFITERVLEQREPTPENVETGIQTLLQNMEPDIQEVVREADVMPNIDMVATLRKFTRHQLTVLIRFIMDPTTGADNFGPTLYSHVRRCIGELIVLCRSCLTGGMPALETLLQSRLRAMTSGINPMIQRWMLSVTAQQLNTFVPTITLTENDTCHFVVPTVAGATESLSANKEAPMETDSASSPSASKVEAKPDKSVAREVPCSSSARASAPIPSPTYAGAMVNGTASAIKVAAPPAGGDEDVSWQSVVPAEWVPIITQDVRRQRQQPAQSPFSDGYLQGMPAKRRKIMTQDRNQDLSNPSEVVPELLRHAVAVAGVEPISSMENLSSEARNDRELQSAFEEQISGAVADRLEKDSDFRAERFPKSEEYYHKKSSKK